MLGQGCMHLSFRKILTLNRYSENQNFKTHPWECTWSRVFSSFFLGEESSFDFQAIGIEPSHFLEIKKTHDQINPPRTQLCPPYSPAQASRVSPVGTVWKSRPFTVRLWWTFPLLLWQLSAPAHPQTGLGSPGCSCLSFPSTLTQHFCLSPWFGTHSCCAVFLGTHLFFPFRLQDLWCKSLSAFSTLMPSHQQVVAVMCWARGHSQYLLSQALSCGSPFLALSNHGSNFPQWWLPITVF